MRLAALCAAVAFPALCSVRVLPTPQSITWSGEPVLVLEPQPLQIVMPGKPSKQAQIAAEWLRSSLAGMNSTIAARVVTAKERGGARVAIFLWDAAEGLPPITLAQADREALDGARRFGQSYVLLTRGNKEIWAIGSTGQGVLYAVATLVQLFEPAEHGLRVDGVHVRDFPDFRYRAASDWLLRAELNRWAYDWGDGRRAYVQRIKRKLDFCTRFKINMVLFDGFGWTAEKTPGYAEMMRDLNAYARDRGIKLMFSGFGANFDPAKVEPEFNIGKVFFNRDSYPHGRIYPCFGEARTADHPTFGTCRSNEALNAEIAGEFESFVRAVEPGALYIHHEDTGHYDRTQLRWSERCDRCKQKWPNPDFAAADGGAGAMAHGYANILRAVQRVKNVDSGYDAARDCTTVFISPPYGIDSGRSGMGSEQVNEDLNWNKTLEFWGNVLSLMPTSDNLEIGFREIFPHSKTGAAWMDEYRRHMAARNLNQNVFLFFLGGADQYSAGSFGYPYAGNSAMNGLFRGAEALYNFNGGLHQEPQQVLNAEFAWNASAPGSQVPKTFREALDSWHALMSNDVAPAEIFAKEGVFDAACARIYGVRAGDAMARFFRFHELSRIPNASLPRFYPTKIYPVAVLWRYLQGDSAYWSPDLGPDEKMALRGLNVSRAEFQRRLAALWDQTAGVNRKALAFVEQAENAPDLRRDAREDVTHLRRCLTVGERFARLLAAYHEFLVSSQAEDALAQHKQLTAYLNDNFTLDRVDPKGGDLSSWWEALERMRDYILARKK